MGYSITVSLNGDYIRLDYSDIFQTVTCLVLLTGVSSEFRTPYSIEIRAKVYLYFIVLILSILNCLYVYINMCILMGNESCIVLYWLWFV